MHDYSRSNPLRSSAALQIVDPMTPAAASMDLWVARQSKLTIIPIAIVSRAGYDLLLQELSEMNHLVFFNERRIRRRPIISLYAHNKRISIKRLADWGAILPPPPLNHRNDMTDLQNSKVVPLT